MLCPFNEIQSVGLLVGKFEVNLRTGSVALSHPQIRCGCICPKQDAAGRSDLCNIKHHSNPRERLGTSPQSGLLLRLHSRMTSDNSVVQIRRLRRSFRMAGKGRGKYRETKTHKEDTPPAIVRRLAAQTNQSNFYSHQESHWCRVWLGVWRVAGLDERGVPVTYGPNRISG
jgi:hypothetical protein